MWPIYHHEGHGKQGLLLTFFDDLRVNKWNECQLNIQQYEKNWVLRPLLRIDYIKHAVSSTEGKLGLLVPKLLKFQDD